MCSKDVRKVRGGTIRGRRGPVSVRCSRDFDLGWRKDGRIVASNRQERQMNRADAPAMVFECAVEWRRAVDITDQTNRRRVEVFRNGHSLVFGSVDYRLDGEIIMERL